MEVDLFAVGGFDEADTAANEASSRADVSKGAGLQEGKRSVDDSCEDGENAEECSFGFHKIGSDVGSGEGSLRQESSVSTTFFARMTSTSFQIVRKPTRLPATNELMRSQASMSCIDMRKARRLNVPPMTAVKVLCM